MENKTGWWIPVDFPDNMPENVETAIA